MKKRRSALFGIPIVIAVVAGVALGALALSCGDPVHNARVDALGPETPGGPGPTHRPGQPCLTCHGGLGPANVDFTVGGTIYQLPAEAGTDPLPNVTVSIFEATQSVDGGTPKATVTNSAGNFYIKASDWSPTYPLHHVTLSVQGSQFSPVMSTTMGRDGSCATCHFDPVQRSSPGHVYFASDPTDLPGASP